MSSPKPQAPQQIPTTTTVSPPSFLTPFITGQGLEGALSNADPNGFLPTAFGLSQNFGSDPLPGAEERLAPLNFGQELGALSLIGRAGAGGEAEGFLTNLLGKDPFDTSRFDPIVASTQGGIVDQFNLNVAPALAGASRNSGSFGNTGLGEIDAAQRFSLARALGEAESNIRLAGVGENLRSGLQAAGLFPSINQVALQNAQAALAGGEVFRGQDQAARDIAFSNFLDERNIPLQRLGILADAITAGSGGGAFRTAQGAQFYQPQPGANPLLTGLGVFGSLAGSAASLASVFSNSQFKDVVGPAPKTLDALKGMDFSRWRYKGEGTVHTGPMAEDFQKSFGVGDGMTINIVDALGVLFVAVKELSEKIDDLT